MKPKKTIALILSGGTGTRLGANMPKQYLTVESSPIITYCLKAVLASPMIDGVQIVAAAQWRDFIKDELNLVDDAHKFMGFSEPGENRQLSIYNGLKDISEYAADESVILIHDAARPNLSGDMIAQCIDGIAGHDGLIPVLPMKDTVYLSDGGDRISSLLERSRVFAGQAPEAFVLGKYLEANECLIQYDNDVINVSSPIFKINGSTEPAVMAGMDVVMIPGDENNYKITTMADLDRFRAALLNEK